MTEGFLKTTMDPEYKKKTLDLEHHFSKYAKKSTDSIGRKRQIPEDAFRTPFEKDSHRVLHSLPFRRLKHKTQVFFAPKDDHICTRMEHSLHVSSISSTICRRLDLNVTLAESIALAHDLGHPPFGHLGEKALERIHKEYNRNNKDSKIPPFYHEAQSLRVIDFFRNSLHEPLNLTYEVRDGVVCHWGEKNEQSLVPQYRKDIKSVTIAAARKQRPATIEGCVVRMADTISYLGRDFEDACMAKLLEPNQLLKAIKSVLGCNNSQIIGTLINDLVENSVRLDYLRFSDKIFKAMLGMKKFNYDSIYRHPKLVGQKKRIHLILNELFTYFLDVLEHSAKSKKLNNGSFPNYPCEIFAQFLRDMKYPGHTKKGQIVSDFVAGMTDNFALNCFESLFTVKSIV
jgi:dGTPase